VEEVLVGAACLVYAEGLGETGFDETGARGFGENDQVIQA
jgi:hypothetical protein